MRLRTPKRYTVRGRRPARVFSLRWVWLWLLAPVLIVLGYQMYNYRDLLGPPIQDAVLNLADDAGAGLATAVAPTPTPTSDPTDGLRSADDAWSRGALEEALRLYAAALPNAPNDLVAHYRYTLGLFVLNRLDEALAAAETLVNADPFNANAWALRAQVLTWRTRYGDAIASALQALSYDPDNARAYAFLAEVYLRQDRGDLAQRTIERALELDPESYEAHAIAGLIQQNVVYDFVAARVEFERSMALAPNIPHAVFFLAALDIGDGGYEDAIALLRDVLDLNPNNTRALYWMGFAYYRGAGDPNQASDYFTRCLEADPDILSCNYMQGRVLIALERPQDAADLLIHTIQLGSSDPYHYWWAARAQTLLGNCPAALQILQQGYALAREQDLTTIFGDYDDSIRECQSAVSGVPLATPTETPDGG